jgi:threonine/homoserine/homoserine lactone efflux protein
MTASNHGRRTAVKAAAGIAVFLAVAGSADLAARARGVLAGVAVIAMAFLACWIAVQFRQLRHPAPARRRSRGRDRELVTAPAALAESQQPAQIAA